MAVKLVNKKTFREAKRKREQEMCERSSEYLFGDPKKGILPW